MRCPTCGTYYEEWDPAKGGDVHAYYPHPFTCLGCKAKDDAYSAIRVGAEERKDTSGTYSHGLQMRLEPNPEASKPPLPMSGRKISGRGATMT